MGVSSLKEIAGGDIPQDANGRPADLALVQADGGAVRWLDDGNSPSATTGFKLAGGEDVCLDSDLNKATLYIASAVEVSFYVVG